MQPLGHRGKGLAHRSRAPARRLEALGAAGEARARRLEASRTSDGALRAVWKLRARPTELCAPPGSLALLRRSFARRLEASRTVRRASHACPIPSRAAREGSRAETKPFSALAKPSRSRTSRRRRGARSAKAETKGFGGRAKVSDTRAKVFGASAKRNWPPRGPQAGRRGGSERPLSPTQVRTWVEATGALPPMSRSAPSHWAQAPFQGGGTIRTRTR
jgi:hypothetical protein